MRSQDIEVLRAFSYDVRNKKPNWYAKLIMWWCFRGTRTKKEFRFHHTADRFIVKNLITGEVTDKIYEADKKYSDPDYKDWVKHYHIINVCDTEIFFGLSQEKLLKKYKRAKSYVGTTYGVPSIFGLVINDIFKIITFGNDGTGKLICSESSIRLYKEEIEERFVINGPIDYYDPLERGRFFGMIPYNE